MTPINISSDFVPFANFILTDYLHAKMDVSSGSVGHLGHSHGGNPSNISMNLNSSGVGMNGPNEGKIFAQGRMRLLRHISEIYLIENFVSPLLELTVSFR